MLSWDDFQGIPKDDDETRKHSLKAMSRTGLRFRIDTKVIEKKTKKKFKIEKITVEATFHKNGSWVKKDQIIPGKESTLLKHEQGHFDTAQLFVPNAQKMLELFVKNKTYTIKEKEGIRLEKIADDESIKITNNKIDQIFEILKQNQRKYDEDTRHGVNQELQNKYNEIFDQLRN